MITNYTNATNLEMSITKNYKFQYSTVDDLIMPIMRVKSPKQVLGKTDDNLPWAEYADPIRKIDKEVLSGKSFILLEQIKTFVGERVLLYNKKKRLLDNHNKVVGIELKSKKIQGNFLFEFLNLITNDTKKFGSQKTCQYLIKDRFKTLTSREMDCLFHLVRGKGIKIIGAILSISPRTVETHICHIKQKLHCHTTSQLIDKAFAEGFISIIPQELILKQPIILDES